MDPEQEEANSLSPGVPIHSKKHLRRPMPQTRDSQNILIEIDLFKVSLDYSFLIWKNSGVEFSMIKVPISEHR